MDNTAIERIATPDLGADALALLTQYETNDEVIFFLGRLVWQGKMKECIPALQTIASDAQRGRYARIAAIRAVMSTGDAEQKDLLWETIACGPGPLDRAFLAELLEWSVPTSRSVELLLRTLDQLEPYKQFDATGLDSALHAFVDRLPLMADDAKEQPLAQLVEGLSLFLGREPHIERGECHVSEEFAWLMGPALHAVDRLVAGRAAKALDQNALAILLKFPALRFWRSGDLSEYRSTLEENVPRWRELNDALYWAMVAEGRETLREKGDRLVDDSRVAYVGHFWRFGTEDFERCLAWISEKVDHDDRLVALSRCIVLYAAAGRPASWAKALRTTVAGDRELENMFEAWLDPKPSPQMEKFETERRERDRQRKTEKQKQERERADWVRALNADPDRVRYPEGMKPGEFSRDHYHLLLSTSGNDRATDRENYSNWRALIPEFGEAVARAYRDAAVAYWRHYQPGLRSEGADSGSTPYALIFAMAGLAIEADEESGFPQSLTGEEARHALRYITWQLNGFPGWFERLYDAHPKASLSAVKKEVVWELEHSGTEAATPYILYDILYHAPWLHAEVAPMLLEWLREHDMPNSDGLRYCLNIMASGGTPQGALAALAEAKVRRATPDEDRPRWYALWVDTEPAASIPALQAQLETLSEEEALRFAQQFIVGLLGDRHGSGSRVGAYRTAAFLKTLYILMHQYIRVTDDIDRAGTGVYSPTLRDSAQEARNALFNILSSVPGPETYAAIKSLEEEHPEPSHRRWMAIRARERAIVDADEPLWTVEQVHAFASSF